MIALLFIFYLHSFSFSQEIICPDGALLMEYELPHSGKVKKTCGYFKNGEVVKHGPEVVTYEGKVVESLNFKNGERVRIDTSKAELESTKIEQTFGALTKLLSILSYDQGKMNHGQFNVGGCDKRPFDWVVMALKKSELQKSYSYTQNCDVSGSFTASFKKEFLVNFDLRNLNSFNHSKMKVKMTSKKGAVGIRYRFEVLDGSISSTDDTFTFKAEYEVDINPQNGHAIFSTQEGLVSITNLEGAGVITRELRF